MKKLVIGLTVLVMLSLKAYAWDGVVTNTIAKIDVVVDGENYGFRVYLNGSPALCGTTSDWAYVNKSSSNYDAIVSSLLAAHMAGRRVTLYTNKMASGYCHIGYLSVH
ncbi:hypothetical protein [Reinekea sp. G2M2-21]|uniref:hypothetical protein n=1 Tax=Reinekea sp. G2M2-21 TaxID=2788942 RepID=UPI0018A9B2AF|nr:hypothetical protein [Reinekea sp. G2M2-21]